MDGGLDSFEKAVPFMPSERVNPLHRSEREKERQFAQTLEEELEEEKKKQREAAEKDQVTLGSDTPNSRPEQRESENGKSVEREADNEQDDETTNDSPEDGHIDVKA